MSAAALGAATPRRALGRDVELQRGAADPVGDRRQVLALGGDVDADDVRAVAREHLGDRRADAARRAGDDAAVWPGERLVPVVRRVRTAARDPDHLAGDVGRAAGEQEAQRRLEVGVRLDAYTSWRSRLADLLAEPSARSPRARAGPTRPGSPVADHDQPRPAGASRRIDRLEELVQRRAGPRSRDAASRRRSSAAYVSAVRRSAPLRVGSRRTEAAAAEQHRRRRRARGPRRSGAGRGSPRRLDHEAARGGESANCWYRSAMC